MSPSAVSVGDEAGVPERAPGGGMPGGAVSVTSITFSWYEVDINRNVILD